MPIDTSSSGFSPDPESDASSNRVPDCACVDECSGDPTSRACRQLPPVGPAIPNSAADEKRLADFLRPALNEWEANGQKFQQFSGGGEDTATAMARYLFRNGFTLGHATRNSAAEPTPEEIWNELGECRLCGTARWPDG